MSKKETGAHPFEGMEPIGEEEKTLLEGFVLDYAREISRDGGRTAKIKGATIIIDQPKAQPKLKP